MKTVRELLQDTDPLRHEPYASDTERDRLRRAVLQGGPDHASSATSRPPALALAITAVLVFGVFVALGSGLWLERGSMVQAQIRFEVRLADDQPSPGLVEAQVSGSDQVVYLDNAPVVTNDDIAESRVVPANAPGRFSVAVEFDAEGAEKMRQATMIHVGKPMAILINGEVITAPVVRTVISTSALITGDYTRAQAERIVVGIGVR